MTDFFNDIGEYFNEYGLRIAFAVCVIVAGILIAWILSFIIKRLLHLTKIDDAAITFIVALVKVAIAVGVVLICASTLDLSTSSLVVSLSTVALAVALALKDSLANLANGILIITNKPFKRGDYVSINGTEGKIQNIKLLTVELVTFNNTKIIMPNSKVIGGDVLNYSAMPIRRVDMNFSVAYGSSMDKVERTLRKVAAADNRVLKTIDPLIFMQSHDSSSVQYVFNVWVNTVDFFTVKNAMPRKVYDAFERENICIPFNQLDVHLTDSNTRINNPMDAITKQPNAQHAQKPAPKVDIPKPTAKAEMPKPAVKAEQPKPMPKPAIKVEPKPAPKVEATKPAPKVAVKPPVVAKPAPAKADGAKPKADATKPTAKAAAKPAAPKATSGEKKK